MLLLGSTYSETQLRKNFEKFRIFFKTFLGPLKLMGHPEISSQLQQFVVEAPSITAIACTIFAKKFEGVSTLLF
jgi:hypothetical protein